MVSQANPYDTNYSNVDASDYPLVAESSGPSILNKKMRKLCGILTICNNVNNL